MPISRARPKQPGRPFDSDGAGTAFANKKASVVLAESRRRFAGAAGLVLPNDVGGFAECDVECEQATTTCHNDFIDEAVRKCGIGFG
jgi:hypothetical protein